MIDDKSRHSSFSIQHSAFLEVALVFAIFFLQGAYPVPDVNEPYYLGKAIHFWNPDWIRGDFFLDSRDTHQVFYFTFGWLSRWLSPWLLAWCGRILTWALLAWAWRRLSFVIVPRRWWAVLTAALMVGLNDWCHLAGEWVVGGVEAKGFAYVFVFLGLAALALAHWNRALAMFGAAAGFHVLVGGWSLAAAGLAWLFSRGSRSADFGELGSTDLAEASRGGLAARRPPLRSLWPGLLAALLLSLPGLWPSLALTRGVDRATVERSSQIYVYERLPHHLDFAQIPPLFKLRFALLTCATAMLAWWRPFSPAAQRLVRFAAGALAICCLGAAISLLSPAGWLRFYWFRLADVIIPAACALLAVLCIVHALQGRRRLGKALLGLTVAAAALHVGGYAIVRTIPTPPRADRLPNYGGWWRACHWVAEPGNVPPRARFLAPRLADTFKWYTGHAEVVNWKEVPQDARAIVEWWRRLLEIHSTGSNAPANRWHESLAELGAARLKELGAKYQADYVITLANPRLPLEAVYENETYIIYRLRR